MKNINITMIGADTYGVNCRLKRAQIFAVFLKNFNFISKKKSKQKSTQEVLYLRNTIISLTYFLRKTLILFLFIENMIIRFN